MHSLIWLGCPVSHASFSAQLRPMANDKVSTEPHLRPDAAKVKQWVGEREWFGEVFEACVCASQPLPRLHIPLVAAENPAEISIGKSD